LVVRKALEGDAGLRDDLRRILGEARPDVTVTQHVSAGRDAYAAGRDLTFTRGPKFAVDLRGGQGVQIGDDNVQRNDFGND
jgi:hypothetical protein